MVTISSTPPAYPLLIKWILAMTADLAAIVMAFIATYYICAGPGDIIRFVVVHPQQLLLGCGIQLAAFLFLRLHRHIYRHASIETALALVAANTLGVTILGVVSSFFFEPWSGRSLLCLWGFSIVFSWGIRLAVRGTEVIKRQWCLLLETPFQQIPCKRIVILGSGSAGIRVLQALREEKNHNYKVIGFLDDHPQEKGGMLCGVPIIGSFDYLYTLLEHHTINEVLIACREKLGEELRPYVLACRRLRVSVRVIPAVHEILSGSTQARLEEISVEDLLRRPPRNIGIDEIGHYLTGQCVLVTGAGGSIGSELCRQIIALDPAQLVLFGHGENSIHQIAQELCTRYPALVSRIHRVIGSVMDEQHVHNIFEKFKPDIVFHAAAHKHVPIMEENIIEAVKNNVFGTVVVANACGKYRVERMVLISTDKAVFPSSVMGATKWLCEEVLRIAAQEYLQTKYLTVRFGNVLGCRGSVVPLFQEQIRRGGPITVTHPEMTRYFMTIPEAVQLALLACANGNTGELYLLDMGEPVRIRDMAEDMIRLCGLEPQVDIPIVYTGLRPGEKLHEKLYSSNETVRPSSRSGFSIVQRPEYFTQEEFAGVLQSLRTLAGKSDDTALLMYMTETIPGFGIVEEPSASPTLKFAA
ncbi:MAG TPA: nucleoside-diphosphate sugar epimerase/dehydratase [Armatimonadota bacterium]|nr:nucleoside-diphosphate sugar epimerase/dehydratase [Armatimonadota bacterium]